MRLNSKLKFVHYNLYLRVFYEKVIQHVLSALSGPDVFHRRRRHDGRDPARPDRISSKMAVGSSLNSRNPIRRLVRRGDCTLLFHIHQDPGRESHFHENDLQKPGRIQRQRDHEMRFERQDRPGRFREKHIPECLALLRDRFPERKHFFFGSQSKKDRKDSGGFECRRHARNDA